MQIILPVPREVVEAVNCLSSKENGELKYSKKYNAIELIKFGLIYGETGNYFLTDYAMAIKKDLAVPRVHADKDGFVTCPYCKGIHRHGGNGNGVASGHRHPDCGNEIGYIVVPAL